MADTLVPKVVAKATAKRGFNKSLIIMKKNILYSIIIYSLVFVSGCSKDKLAGGILLISENFTSDDTKTTVSETAVYWVDGDELRINGQTCTVHVSGSEARATGLNDLGDGDIYGYYPPSIITASGSSGECADRATIIFPAEYESCFRDGRQILSLPMVGKASEGSNSIRFYHLTAAVNVIVKNSTGFPVILDSVEIVSRMSNQRLNGAITVNLSTDNVPTITIPTTSTSATKRVKVSFKDGSATIGSEEYIVVQVPVPPINSANMNDLEFRISTHKCMERVGMPTVNYGYYYARSLKSNGLERNIVKTAQINLTDGGGTYVSEVDHSLFTINAGGTKVRFSQGNLRCSRPNTSTPWNESVLTWSFLENQYDFVENGDVSSNYANETDIGLFGWGTKTCPWKTSGMNEDYSDYYEWGENPIVNGGNTANYGWYTLSGNTGEWNYIFKTRTCSSSGLPTGTNSTKASYVKATVNGIEGLILFPDKYKHPSITVTGSPEYNKENPTANFGCFVVDASGWSKMEAAGAVFLPSTGIRNSTTYRTDSDHSADGARYWTRTNNNSTTAFNIQVTSSSVSGGYIRSDKAQGMPVRLVKNAE